MKLSIFVLHLGQQHVNLNTTCAKSLFSCISRFTGYQVCFDPLSLFYFKGRGGYNEQILESICMQGNLIVVEMV